ncbi:DMT family transporter [uncultured Amnibacterium sp.]|uniref:DMT family transporter n=1 Tax=uncultured Amnibacterium sp. TaxID=1631851 RepID=UPI0035CBF314
MRKWLLLALAVLTEVTASLALRAALDQPAWYVVTVLGYAAAFVLLTLVLKAGMALGVAYGIWGATGVALTAGASAVLFGEMLNPVMLAGIVLVIAGVLTVELGSQRAASRREARR